MSARVKKRVPTPLQPLGLDQHGCIRFQGNKLVEHLLDEASKQGLDMNYLFTVEGIPRTDREQFAQLIGYSLSGFGELPYVRDATYAAAEAAAEHLTRPKKKGSR